MKNYKAIIGIAAAILLLAAGIAAVILYKEQLVNFACGVKEKMKGLNPFKKEPEFEDFAE